MMHARFMVIDHARVITGSYPWESVACEHTFGDVISILNTGIAAAFTRNSTRCLLDARPQQAGRHPAFLHRRLA